MTQEHPITPSSELVEKWYEAIDNSSTSWKQELTTQGPTRDEAVALYSEVMAVHNCQTLGDMAEHFARAVLAKWGKQ